MSGLTTAAANRLIDAANATTALTAAVSPEQTRLTTSAPTASTAGTAVAGGSYAPQTTAWSTASAQAASNSGALSFGPMPATTVVGVDIFDNAGTPFRWWWGPLASSKTTNVGDLLTFAIAAIAEAITS